MLKIFLTTVYILFFLFIGKELNKSFLYRTDFIINNIEITGDYSMLKDELAKVAGDIYGKNKWEIPLEKIKESLLNDIRVDKVKIEYRNKGEVRIEIFQKKPSYYGNLNGNTYMLDKNGDIFASISEGPIEKKIIIYGKNEEELKESLELISKITDNFISKKIYEIRYISLHEMQLFLDSDTLIKTQKDVPEKKYRVVKGLYLDLIKDKKIEYIDLRFDGYIVK